MKILVTSDTHENYPLLFQACESVAPFDVLIHLGDGSDDANLVAHALGIEVISVAGNCDTGSHTPRERIWECGNQRFLLTHGDRYGVKKGIQKLERRGIEAGAHAVLYGHSHLAAITSLGGVLFVNPGTLMKTAQRKTVAILEIKPAGFTALLTDIA
jgi:putative phosphoesterase